MRTRTRKYLQKKLNMAIRNFYKPSRGKVARLARSSSTAGTRGQIAEGRIVA